MYIFDGAWCNAAISPQYRTSQRELLSSIECSLCPLRCHTHCCIWVCKCSKEHAAGHRPVCGSMTDKTELLQVLFFNTIHCCKEAICCYFLIGNHRLHTLVHTSHLFQTIEMRFSVNPPACNIYMRIPVARRNFILCMRLQSQFARERTSIAKHHPCFPCCITQL